MGVLTRTIRQGQSTQKANQGNGARGCPGKKEWEEFLIWGNPKSVVDSVTGRNVSIVPEKESSIVKRTDKKPNSVLLKKNKRGGTV